MNAKPESAATLSAASTASALTRPIRVVQLTGAMDFGGLENVIGHLARGLDPARFEVNVVCTRGIGTLGEQLRSEGANVLLMSEYKRSRRHLAPFDLLKTLRQLKPDIVHSHGEPPLAAAGPLGYLGLMPYWVHSFHYGNYPYAESKRMFVERVLSRPAKALIAVADQQRALIVKHHRVNPDRIRTLWNGVKPNAFTGDPAVRARMRAEFGMAEDDLVVGTVAVLSKQKGVTHLLQAARTVLATHPKAKFLIAGGGPLEQALRDEAQALGLGNRVHFTGWRKDVQQILQAFDMFVMSSLWEAMPLTLLEAMAARQALVVTDVGDNRLLVGNGEFALVVPPADSAALAAAITRLLEDRVLAARFAAAGAQAFERQFTVGHMIAAHERFYESVVCV
jgi:glycosyltransferase involved in cell wall biosynthesis